MDRVKKILIGVIVVLVIIIVIFALLLMSKTQKLEEVYSDMQINQIDHVKVSKLENDIVKLKEEVNEKTTETSKIKEEKVITETQLIELKKEIENYKKTIEEKEKEIKEKSELIQKLQLIVNEYNPNTVEGVVNLLNTISKQNNEAGTYVGNVLKGYSSVKDIEKRLEQEKNDVQEANEIIEEQKQLIESQNVKIIELEKIVKEKDSRIGELESEIAEKNATISSLQETVNYLNRAVQLLEEKVANKDKQITELENKLKDEQDKVNQLNKQKEELEKEIAQKNNTIVSQNNTIADQSNTINELNNTVANQNNTINELNNTVSNQSNTIDQLNSKINELNNKLRISSDEIERLNAQITQLKNDKVELQATIDQLREENAQLKDDKSNLELQVGQLESDKTNLELQVSQLESDKAQLQETIRTKEARIQELESENASLRQQIASLTSSDEAEIARLNGIIAEKQAEIDRLNAELTEEKAKVTARDQEIANKQTQINNLTSQVNSLQTQLNSINTRISSITATAGDIRSGKKALNSSGNLITGTWSPAIYSLGTTSLTSNGTYNAANFGYDGFSSVTVDVQTGTSHTGTYTPEANKSNNDMGISHSYRYVDTSGMIIPSGTKTITSNGTDIDVSKYSKVTVNVPTSTYSSGTKSITSNGTYYASTYGYDGFSRVTVNVPVPSGYVYPSGTKTITANADNIDVSSYSKVNVRVPTGTANLGEILINKGGTYNAADEGLDGYSSITVNGQEHNRPQVTINPNNGLITASHRQSIGTIVEGEEVTTGLETYVKDFEEDLKSKNIRAGVNIFGIEGNIQSEAHASPTIEVNNNTGAYTVEHVQTNDRIVTGPDTLTVSGNIKDFDEFLRKEYIRSGVNILGVDGTYEGPTQGSVKTESKKTAFSCKGGDVIVSYGSGTATPTLTSGSGAQFVLLVDTKNSDWETPCICYIWSCTKSGTASINWSTSGWRRIYHITFTDADDIPEKTESV